VGCTAPHEGTTDASSWWVLAAYPTRLECESKRSVLHRQRSSDDASYACLPDTVARAEGEVVGGRVDRLHQRCGEMACSFGAQVVHPVSAPPPGTATGDSHTWLGCSKFDPLAAPSHPS